MKKAQKLVLAGAALLLLAGCGTTTKQVVRRSEILSPTGQPIAVVQPAITARPQYDFAPDILADDPLVAKAQAIGQQRRVNRARWDRACLEMRRADPVYTTYTDCRRLLGDRESFSSIGYTGSIFSNSPGIVWK